MFIELCMNKSNHNQFRTRIVTRVTRVSILMKVVCTSREEEEERLQLMRDTLDTLRQLLEATKQNGQQLTSLNTGVRANSMVLRDIADNQRTQLREDQRWRSEERAERVRQRFVPARTRSSTSTSRSGNVRSVIKKADKRKWMYRYIFEVKVTKVLLNLNFCHICTGFKLILYSGWLGFC